MILNPKLFQSKYLIKLNTKFLKFTKSSFQKEI